GGGGEGAGVLRELDRAPGGWTVRFRVQGGDEPRPYTRSGTHRYRADESRAGERRDGDTMSDLFLRLGIALGLGLLVGLQRERVHTGNVAGVRTFALVSLAGAVCGRLSIGLGGWVLAAGLLALAALLVIANYTKTRDDDHDPGLTTEVAALLMFAVGAF